MRDCSIILAIRYNPTVKIVAGAHGGTSAVPAANMFDTDVLSRSSLAFEQGSLIPI